MRFIPACAGNTARSCRRAQIDPVHPRVCGEHYGKLPSQLVCGRFIPACAGQFVIVASMGSFAGSSPRVRGTLLEAVRSCPAGSSPRVRGTLCGSTLESSGIRLFSGSSPRVRGTLPEVPISSGFQRFIPACAGNTATFTVTFATALVHPRVCGEHRDILGFLLVTVGSSPRVRGTPDRTGPNNPPTRFIPACAGNTSLQPRPIIKTGSSPRVRGTR